MQEPYYVPPDEFLKPNEASREVERLLHNILAWERTQLALRHSEEKYRSIVEAASDAVISVDKNGQIFLANQAATRVFGYTLSELPGMPLTILMPEFLRDSHTAGFQRYLNTGERTMDWQRVEFIGMRKTGDQFPVEISFGEFVNNGQRTFTGFIRDITERKRAEDELRRQKETLQKIFDYAPVMISLRGPDGTITFANREWERTLGWTLEEVLGHDLDLLTEAYPDATYRQEVMKFISGSETKFAELTVRARDGRAIETSWDKVHLSDGADIYMGRDITERKQTENRLREYEKAVEGLEEMIAVVDRQYRYLIGNRAFLSYMGLEREQLIGRFVQDMTNPGVFENLVKAKLDECFRGNVVKYELKYLVSRTGREGLVCIVLSHSRRRGYRSGCLCPAGRYRT